MTSHKQQFIAFFGYEGRRFHGVAPQPDVPTAGAALWQRLAHLTSEPPHAVSFAARTDAGVSARHNLVSFRLNGPSDADAVVAALQYDRPDGLFRVVARALPKRVMARSMAARKHYCYRLAGPDATPADTPADGPPRAMPDAAVWRLAVPLNVVRLRRALACFVGRHDFSGFCRAGRPQGDPCKTVYAVDVCIEDALADGAPCIAIRVHGDGFLRRMVRMMVFVAVEAACGLRAVRQIPSLLRPETSGTRVRVSAPACGLTLERLTLTPAAQAMCDAVGNLDTRPTPVA